MCCGQSAKPRKAGEAMSYINLGVELRMGIGIAIIRSKRAGSATVTRRGRNDSDAGYNGLPNSSNCLNHSKVLTCLLRVYSGQSVNSESCED